MKRPSFFRNKFFSHLVGIIVGFGISFLIYMLIGGEAFFNELPEQYKEISLLGMGFLFFVLASGIQRFIYEEPAKPSVEETYDKEAPVIEVYIPVKREVDYLFIKSFLLSCALVICLVLFYGLVLKVILSPEKFQGLFIWGGGAHLDKGVFNIIWFGGIAAMLSVLVVCTYRMVKTPYWWIKYFGEGNKRGVLHKGFLFLLLLASGIFNIALMGFVIFLVGGVAATFFGAIVNRSILLVLVIGFICLAVYLMGEIIMSSFEKWHYKLFLKGEKP